MWPGALSALSAALSPVATSVDKGECVGGATLSLLHDRSFSYTGDSQAQELKSRTRLSMYTHVQGTVHEAE